MTPLLGTKNSSAPVGDKSGGDRRSARSLLPCALWRGMGRLWRGMGDPSRCFSVHDCSPLFTIVRHCSAKNITSEPVSPLRPHRQRGLYGFHETRNTRHESRHLCFSRITRHETRNVSPFGSPWERKRHITKNLRPATVSLRPFAWPCAVSRGYGAAWAAAVPHTGNTACWVFTSHESRNMVFPCPCRDSKDSNPKPDQQVFHETRNTAFMLPRNTNHESRPLCFPTHHFPAFPGNSRHYSAPPPPNRSRVRPPSTVLGGSHEERLSLEIP